MRTAVVSAVAVLVATGCLQPTLVECGDLACAASQVCHDQRCLDPALIAECNSVEEGAACDALGAPGHCTSGVCEIATCGDGYVDTELHEACDDSVPATHCIDVGYDLGRPGCAACQVDPTSGCTRFGWDRVVDAATTFMWTDGTTLAYLTVAPPALEVHAPGGDVLVPGSYFGVFGAANGRVVAWNSNGIVEVANGVSRMFPQLPTSIVHVRMDDNGTTYALAGCTIRALAIDATTWTTLGTLTGPSCGRLEVGPVVNGHPRVMATRGDPSANELWEYNWTTMELELVRAMPAAIANMRIQPTPSGDVIWVSTGNAVNLYKIVGSGQTTVPVNFGATTMVFVGDDIFFADTIGTVARMRGSRISRFRAPGGLIIGGGDRLYSYRGPIHRFSGITWGTRSPIVPPTPVEIVDSLVEADGTVIVASHAQLHTPNLDGGTWTHTTVPAPSIRAIAGAAPNYFLSSFDDTSPSAALLATTTGISGSWTAVASPPSQRFYGLWRASDGALFAVGDDGGSTAFLGVLRGTQWETHAIAGCTAHAVSGTDATHVVAAGACGDEAVLWTYDGSAWTELARPALPGPLDAVVRFSDSSIIAAGTRGATWLDGTTWHVDREAVGQHLSGTSGSDVWLSGAFTSVQRFDGAVWSKLAVSSSGPIAVAASADRVLFPGASADYVELVR